MTLPIHEFFSTFQGEGVHMGRPAFFLRTFGCPVQCPWCDSAGTWHRDWVPKDVRKMDSDQILFQIKSSPRPDFVVITGGEPAVHDLGPLCAALYAAHYPVHIETSGGFPIRGRVDWITLSPKRWKYPLSENVHSADEFKVIVETKEDIEFYYRMIRSLGHRNSQPIWLHPEWSHREDPVVLGAISDAVKEANQGFRAGWQLHKLYRVDARDTRTQPLAPLGGDLRKGY